MNDGLLICNAPLKNDSCNVWTTIIYNNKELGWLSPSLFSMFVYAAARRAAPEASTIWAYAALFYSCI